MPLSQKYIKYEEKQNKLALLVYKYTETESSRDKFLKLINFLGASTVLDSLDYWNIKWRIIVEMKERLRQVRKDQGLTTEEMAIRLSRKLSTYKRLETKVSGDKNGILLRDIKAFIHEFGVGPYWLLTGEHNMYNRFNAAVLQMGYDFRLSFSGMFALQMYGVLDIAYRQVINTAIFGFYHATQTGPMLQSLKESKKNGTDIHLENYITNLDDFEYDKAHYESLKNSSMPDPSTNFLEMMNNFECDLDKLN